MRFSLPFLVALVGLAAAADSHSTKELESIKQATENIRTRLGQWDGSVAKAIPVYGDCQKTIQLVRSAIQATIVLERNAPLPEGSLVEEGLKISRSIVEDIEAAAGTAIVRKDDILAMPFLSKRVFLDMIQQMKLVADGATDICVRLSGSTRAKEGAELKFRALRALEKADSAFRQ